MHDESAGAGRFCWRELATTDFDQAIDFYTRLFPWKVRKDPAGAGPASATFILGDREIGAIRRLEPTRECSSRWYPCVLVEDVHATVERACRLGGDVERPPAEELWTGRSALIRDPAGAAIAPVQRAPAATRGDPTHGPGAVCWNELITHDPFAVAGFYTEVFGWTLVEQETECSGRYWLYKHGEAHAGGMTALPGIPASDGTPAAAAGQWLPYILVEDVDASSELAASLEARILVEPADIPHVGRYSVIQDAGRALVALFQTQ